MSNHTFLASITTKPRWVCYRLEDGDKKIPYRPRLPLTKAMVSDPASWGTYEEACALQATGQVTGIGYVLGDGESGVDLDDSRNPETGELTEEAQRIIAEMNSYTEVSPSQTGIKIFVKTWLAQNHIRKGLEVYGHGRYFVVTGLHLDGTPQDLEPRASEIEALIAREFGADLQSDDGQEVVDDRPELEPDDSRELIDANRNNTLTQIGGALRRLGLDDEELKAALRAVNLARCKPPLENREVDVIARSLGKYAPSKAERAVEWMNEHHSVVFEAGKTQIFTERRDELLDRIVYDRSSAEDIRLFYKPNRVHLKVGNKKVVKTLGDYWLDHPARRGYRGVIFDPEGKIPDPSKLNLWRGFTVEPKEGDWSLFRTHLHQVICRGDDTVFDFVLKWLARLVQKPGRPAETGIALRGRQGTGKGMVGRIVGSIFGQHYLQVTHAHHLVGHFNAHLQDAVFVFADEAVAPQDKAAVSALKALITEPRIQIERKGKDSFMVRNVIHLFMASNHDWVLPAELDERRWTMLDVDPRHANDHRYFAALLKQMKDGGREAMLHDLQQVDLTGWNHRAIPHTQALLEQKQATMSPLHQWWFGKLEDGALWNGQWPAEVPKHSLYENYCEALDRMGHNRKLSETQFGPALQKLTPEWVRFRKRAGGHPTWFVRVPQLSECRRAWETFSKATSGYRWNDQGPMPEGSEDGTLGAQAQQDLPVF